jgi:hypothetical protein
VCAGRKQKRHRHRIEDGDKRQSEKADRSLEVGVPISFARYRTGPTSASARRRWPSILTFSICKLASACPSRWRSATISARSRRFWSAIVIARRDGPIASIAR